jgi:hypothetical protein
MVHCCYSLRLVAESPPSPERFMIFEAHSREMEVVLSRELGSDTTANSTSPALLVPPAHPAQAFLANYNLANITVLGKHLHII